MNVTIFIKTFTKIAEAANVLAHKVKATATTISLYLVRMGGLLSESAIPSHDQ